MKHIRRIAIVGGLAAALTTVGCDTMTQREKSTAIGAGVGAVAGSVLTDGSTVGTLGGAAVGGLAGNEYGKRRYGR
jgi:osmotically inducible lipoprotein OsmB